MNESEEREEIKPFSLYPYLLQGQQALPNCKPISVGCPGDTRYTTPLPHPTTPHLCQYYSSRQTSSVVVFLYENIGCGYSMELQL